MMFKNIIITGLLISLFAVSLFTFGTIFSYDNNKNVSISKSPAMIKIVGNLTKELNASQKHSEDMQSGLISESSHPVVTALGFVFTSILDSGIIMMSMGIGIFNTISVGVMDVFGLNEGQGPIITGVLMAILLITLVFGAWRVYRAGE